MPVEHPLCGAGWRPAPKALLVPLVVPLGAAGAHGPSRPNKVPAGQTFVNLGSDPLLWSWFSQQTFCCQLE